MARHRTGFVTAVSHANEDDRAHVRCTEPVLTVADAARRLKVSKAIVYKLIHGGALPHFRVINSIRIREADLTRYMDDAR